MNKLFRTNNISAFVICFIHMAIIFGIVYALEQEPFFSFGIALGVYVLMFVLAIFPAGEWVCRVACGGRRITRYDWQQKVDVLNELIHSAAIADEDVRDDIKIYYINDPIPSSLSFGRKTICLTSGLLDMDINTIKGCVAHELGHISAYDSSISLVANVGNFFVFLLGMLFQSFYLFNNATHRYRRGSLWSVFRSFLLFMPVAIIFLTLGLSRIILNIGNRSKEYEADAYAVRLGYRNEIRNAIINIDFESQSRRRSLWQMMTSAHPSMNDRLGRIDILGNIDVEQNDIHDLYQLMSME